MTRLENTILYLLTKAEQKGIDNLSRFQIFKLLYLLEVESYKFLGKSFFDSISFVREKNGPISVDVYNALSNLNNKYIKIKETKKPDYPYPRHCIFLKKPIKRIDLGESEKLFMNSVFESYLNLPMNKLKKIVYDTQPMKKIQEEEKRQKLSVLKGQRVDFSSIPLDEDMVDLISV